MTPDDAARKLYGGDASPGANQQPGQKRQQPTEEKIAEALYGEEKPQPQFKPGADPTSDA